MICIKKTNVKYNLVHYVKMEQGIKTGLSFAFFR